MKVSIVTTCFNREATIGHAIRSVMSQTYPDIEHIVVDGASTDGTLEEIKKCNSPRIAMLISEKDHGCYEALNKGLRAATGDIVCWLHSDDFYYSDDVIAHVVKRFEETHCDFLYACGMFVSPDNPDNIIRVWPGGYFSNEKIENGWLPLHTTCFARREILERFGYYDERYKIASDTFWLLSCMYKTGIHIEYMPEYVVKMDYGGLSTSWNKTFLRWREDLDVYSRIGLPPVRTVMKKVLRKIPQFVKARFSKLSK